MESISQVLAEVNLWEALFREPGVGAILGLALCFVLLIAIPVFAVSWVKVAKARSETELKRSMVERGMSPEEMEKVLRLNSQHPA